MRFRPENAGLASLMGLNTLISIARKIKLLAEPSYYVVGDSHAFSFTNPKFELLYLGPTPAHNLGKKNSSSKSREKLIEKLSLIKDKKKPLIFVFGEIDTRIHFYYQYMKNRKRVPLAKFIEATVANYTRILKDSKKKRFNVAVFNVVPSGDQPNIYAYEYYADKETMIYMTAKFNKILKDWCKKNDVLFIDIFSKLSPTSGKREKKYVLDRIHFNPRVAKLVIDYLENEKH